MKKVRREVSQFVHLEYSSFYYYFFFFLLFRFITKLLVLIPRRAAVILAHCSASTDYPQSNFPDSFEKSKRLLTSRAVLSAARFLFRLYFILILPLFTFIFIEPILQTHNSARIFTNNNYEFFNGRRL